jgi:hypothetical protein
MGSNDMPRTRFVILAAPRTGSNMLCTLLGSHPEILCHHEVFNPAGIFYALPYRDGGLDLGTIEERDREPLKFLDRLWRSPLGFRYVGFKMTRGQDETVLQAVLDDPGIRKVILKRRSRLKTYVSEMISIQTGQWEVYRAGDLIANRPKVRVDVSALRAHIALNDAFYTRIEKKLADSGQTFASVVYESLSRQEERRRLLAFLAVSPRTTEMRIASVKQNPTDVRESIANCAELDAALAGSDLAQELLACE